MAGEGTKAQEIQIMESPTPNHAPYVICVEKEAQLAKLHEVLNVSVLLRLALARCFQFLGRALPVGHTVCVPH